MAGDSFTADTAAFSQAASAFHAEVEPISAQGRRLTTIKGSASTTGRDYQAQGTAYHDAIAGPNSVLAMIISQFSHRCDETSIKLASNGRDYESNDASNSAALRSSGTGA
ncbi:MAG TPA: hypothetical protein VIG48_06745 [Jatrophihabitans sp.]|jgi:hypothetical protein